MRRKAQRAACYGLLSAIAALATAACAAPRSDRARHGAAIAAPDQLAALERRLLAAPGVFIEYEITSRGAFEANVRGTLQLAAGRRAKLVVKGAFAGKPVDLTLLSDGQRLVTRGGAKVHDGPTPRELDIAIVVGLTRMGLLHNIAMLTSGAPPDHAARGVREWVRPSGVTREPSQRVDGQHAAALAFGVVVSGKPAATARLWLATDALPLRREQVVRFRERAGATRTMKVVERYTRFELARVAPAAGVFDLKAPPAK